MPRVLPARSQPKSVSRTPHWPARVFWSSWMKLRASARMQPIACSATVLAFDSGAKVTQMPSSAARATSMLSHPTPCREMTLSFLPASMTAAG